MRVVRGVERGFREEIIGKPRSQGGMLVEGLSADVRCPRDPVDFSGRLLSFGFGFLEAEGGLESGPFDRHLLCWGSASAARAAAAARALRLGI